MCARSGAAARPRRASGPDGREAMDAAALLRPDLLAGRVIALAGGTELGAPLARLGATAVALADYSDDEQAAARVREALVAHERLDVLVHDLRPGFARGGYGGLRATLDTAWVAVRAVATTAWIEAGRGGRIVLVVPPPSAAVTPAGDLAAAGTRSDAGDAAAADDPAVAGVRAAAENLARTLSIEWSRYAVTTVAITPGAQTTDGELAALAAYLASPAGDYWSGCRVALGEVLVTTAV